MTIPLGLDGYQTKAIRTDRTRKSGAELDLTVLGLVGEAGSLLSEVKKKQRDSRSYLGYEDAVTEEMGDMLWYLAAVAHHHELKLSEIAASCGALPRRLRNCSLSKISPSRPPRRLRADIASAIWGARPTR